MKMTWKDWLIGISILSLVMFGAAACDKSVAKAEEPRVGYWTKTGNSLDYFIDKRTNLCYAALDLGRNMQSIANVPCNNKVVALSKN